MSDQHEPACLCFDCRMKTKAAAEQMARDNLAARRAEADRQAYIERRGGEPHVPNRKERT